MQAITPPFRLPRTLEILLGVVVLFELIAPFITKTYGVDGRLQVNMIAQFTHLVSEGALFPRWVPEGFYGFGSSAFYFYPPVMLYLASIFRIVFRFTNPYVLYQMTGLLATIASYYASRMFFSSVGASKYQVTIGAILFAFGPFRLADLYGRSNLATHVAYVFIPLIWYGLVEIVRRKDSRRVTRIVHLAISSALLALTNVPTALASGVCIVLAGILFRKRLTWSMILDISIAASIAAGLCAFHFLSAITFGPYANLASLDGGDPQFILLQLFRQSSVPALYYLGLLYIPVPIIALHYWLSRTSQKTSSEVELITVQIGLAIAALTLFLEMPYISLPVWRYIPVFKLIQFGWRFYPHFVLFSSAIVAVAATMSIRGAAHRVTWIWAIGAIGPAMLITFSLHLFAHSSRPLEDAIEYRPINSMPNDNFIKRLPPNQAVFFPVSVEMNRIYSPHEQDSPAIADYQDREQVLRTISKASLEEYQVRLTGSRMVTFHRFYWPAWHLYVNDQEIPSHPDSIGRAAANLPAGHYTATWKLERTPLETAGLWISGITWIGVLIFVGIGLIHSRVKKKDTLAP